MSKIERILIKAINDPKQTFFKKYKITDNQISVIKKAYKERDIKKNKKSEVLLARGKKKDNQNKTLLGG